MIPEKVKDKKKGDQGKESIIIQLDLFFNPLSPCPALSEVARP